MKAIRIHNYGGSGEMVLEDAPKPTIAKDEVLVKVHAAGVNPVDWKIREGLRKNVFPSNLPLILGRDVSGVVEEVGTDVMNFKVGDEVYAMSDASRDGSYAEYIALRASIVAYKPQKVDHVTAAAVPLASLTAWQALFDAGSLHEGQKLLILGASGGVGSFAVQFAKWKKAYVIGVCSTRNVDYLRVIGANEVIDYTATLFEKQVSDVDIVFDTVGGEVKDRAWSVLKPGGTLVTIVRQSDMDDAAAQGKRGIFVNVKSKPEQLDKISKLIDNGIVRPVISTVLPLSEAPKALDTLQNGLNLRGKIVLKVV